MKKSKNTLTTLLAGYMEVERVTRLVGRVLAKYPRHTVPAHLDAFLDAVQPHATVTSVRPTSRDANVVVVTITGIGFAGGRTARLPVEWLDMHESEITVAVRKVYWASKGKRLHDAVRSQERVIAEREQQIERKQEAQERDRRELDRLRAALENHKKRGR